MQASELPKKLGDGWLSAILEGDISQRLPWWSNG